MKLIYFKLTIELTIELKQRNVQSMGPAIIWIINSSGTAAPGFTIKTN